MARGLIIKREKGIEITKEGRRWKRRPLRFLPDANPFAFRAVHFVAGLHVKGFVEGREIGERAICPVHTGCMGIGQYLLAQCFIAVFDSPDSRPGNEKSLFRRKSINRAGFSMLAVVALQTFKSGRDAPQITDILTKGKTSLNKNTRKRLVLVELLGKAFTFFAESRQVFFGKPVPQV